MLRVLFRYPLTMFLLRGWTPLLTRIRKSFPRTGRLAVPLILLSLAALPAVLHAQRTAAPSAAAARPVDMGAVRPSNLVLPQLATLPVGGGADSLARIVSYDLELADVAMPPLNSNGVAEASRASTGSQFDYDAWTRAGVNYVVRINLGGREAQAELYDVASKQRVIGKTYSGSNPQDRMLGHKIADDIMQALTNRPGIFSSRICFLGQRAQGKRDVMMIDADGSNLRQLTHENSTVASPCWGMNGGEVIYTTYRDNNPDLAGMTLAGRRFDVSRRPGLNTAPSWNARTSRLAVSLSKDGNAEIYTMTREGRSLRRLTNTPGADTAPDWNPDGSMLVFTSDRGGSPQIYMMDASGGGARRISTGGYCDSPSWSPDGSKVAYVVREGGEFNIYVVDLQGGGGAVRLTKGARDNTDPSWAPNSRHLVFASTRSGARELYLMNIDTKVAKPLTRGAFAMSPAWGPLLP